MAAESAPPLLVADGAKEPFGKGVQLSIPLTAGWGEIIHHQ
jgi:hypothetical protein